MIETKILVGFEPQVISKLVWRNESMRWKEGNNNYCFVDLNSPKVRCLFHFFLSHILDPESFISAKALESRSKIPHRSFVLNTLSFEERPVF